MSIKNIALRLDLDNKVDLIWFIQLTHKNALK